MWWQILFIYIYVRKIGRAPGFEHKVRGKVGRGRIMGESDHRDPNEKGMTKDQVAAYRAGRRRDGNLHKFYIW